jgi:hypothetical protein
VLVRLENFYPSFHRTYCQKFIFQGYGFRFNSNERLVAWFSPSVGSTKRVVGRVQVIRTSLVDVCLH